MEKDLKHLLGFDKMPPPDAATKNTKDKQVRKIGVPGPMRYQCGTAG